jgi:pyrroline-5-carboxylate reductase
MPLGKTLAFLGAGNMAEALVKGLLRAGVAAAGEIVLAEPRRERGAELVERHGVRLAASNLAAVEEADLVVLSVKPQALAAVLDEVGPALGPKKLVVSIVAGVPLAALERKAQGARVVRTMPNTPALVGAGATALAPGRHATADDLALARALFDAVGSSVVVDESLLDAVTGLSGSGPGYVFVIIEALSDAGVKVGLTRAAAVQLAAQTVLGSAKLLLETGEHPGRLKDQVTSPGGTTIAGLYAMEARGLRAALIEGVEAATRRSRELGAAFLEGAK